MRSLFIGKVPRKIRAFTLVEMLVVMGIIIILMALVGPAAVSLLKGTDLTQAGQMISDQLASARQTAQTRNNPVEVRLYQFGDPSVAGESATAATTGKYRGMQSFEILPSGKAIALGKILRLPKSTIIDSGSTLSSMLDKTKYPALEKWPNSSGATDAKDPKVNLPQTGQNYACRAFRFYPDGSTNLPKAAATSTSAGATSPSAPILMFCTLHNLNEGDELTQPTSNFFTVQIDAYNGHIRTLRP